MSDSFRITRDFAERTARAVKRVESMPFGESGGLWGNRFEEMPQHAKRSRYFRTTEQMMPCMSAAGIEVRLVSPECVQVEDFEGAIEAELFDVSNSVRIYNLVSQRTIHESLPVGSIIEAVRERQVNDTSSGDDFFWRVLQVLSCDCASSSISSSSDSSSSSGSGECESPVIGGVDLSTIPTGSASFLLGIDPNGCLVRIETTECPQGSGSA